MSHLELPEDFSVVIIFSPLTNKADIFFQSKSSSRILGDYRHYPLQDFFHSNKVWGSPTYCKTTEVLSQRFNELHLKKKDKSSSPRGGNPNSMQSIGVTVHPAPLLAEQSLKGEGH